MFHAGNDHWGAVVVQRSREETTKSHSGKNAEKKSENGIGPRQKRVHVDDVPRISSEKYKYKIKSNVNLMKPL